VITDSAQKMGRALPLAGEAPAQMSDATFQALRTIIYNLTGIYFQDNKKYLLESRIGKRLQPTGCRTYEDYLRLLTGSIRKDEELKCLYTAITINETFFFRNEPQFQAFEQTIIPGILAAKGPNGRPKIRIWSAASSSGEEAYTLGMIYHERLRVKYPGLEIEIVGTDINQTVIDTASRGIYREYSIRNMPKAYLDKYFAAKDDRYYLSDEIRRYARFEFLNLYDRNRMRMMNNFDVIFCCNVLIYFDTKSKIQVVSDLYNALGRGGHLFIGYAETLHGISSAFKLINFPKTVAYKKE
jgi:chemotaxis protein methyltransferase CheR